MGFFGLEIGKRAIVANQSALNVVGHNMANANTAGYSQQVANLSATQPYSAPSLNSSTEVGQMGTGVEVESITRLRDSYVDSQYRYQNSSAGYWSATDQTLDKIQTIVNEPSDNGLRSVLDQFWQSWQDLSSNPESDSDRAVVAQRGASVADAFQQTYKQLSDMKNDLNANVKIDVDQINTIGSQIKDLNSQILAINVSGNSPNDLEDKRDLLIDQLSKLVNVKVSNGDNGMVNVNIGGRSLVQGTEFNSLGTQEDSAGMHMVVWSDTQTQVQITGGEVMSYLDARGKTSLTNDAQGTAPYKETVPAMIDQLNALAKTVVTKTNELQSSGYSLNNTTQDPDGTDFFTMPSGDLNQYTDWAKTMGVESAITSDAKNIAAAAKPTYDTSGAQSNFGDGDNALAIADLKQDLNNGVITYTNDVSLTTGGSVSFDVNIGGTPTTINVNDASSAYSTTAKWVQAIQAAMTAAGVSDVTVTADKNRLVFSSSDTKFTGVSSLSVNGGTGANYSALQMVKGETTDDFWNAVAAEVGVGAQEASRNSTNQDALVTEVDNQRQTVSGVSLDEEATNMIQYQHAFNAASRYITTVDDMLSTLIDKMGLVGR